MHNAAANTFRQSAGRQPTGRQPSSAVGAGVAAIEAAPREPNNALLSKYGLPRHFTWRGKKHHIKQIGGHWYRRGRWWQDEPERHFFRIMTTDGITLDLCHDPGTGKWSIALVHD